MNKYWTAACQALSAFLGSLLGINFDIWSIFQEVFMSKSRKKVSKRGSRRLFRATAMKTHKKNIQAYPMRGGIRLQHVISPILLLPLLIYLQKMVS